MVGRLTLGLYNSYDPRRFFEAHRRALVRAAALALAFDAGVATFGFPFDDLGAHGGRTAENRSRGATMRMGGSAEPVKLGTPIEIAESLAKSTSIAAAGAVRRGPGRVGNASRAEAAPLAELARAGRFHVFDLPESMPVQAFPPELGTIVLTTEHAKCPKDTSARTVARELVNGKDQLLVFGLGPHGTPKDVAAMAAWELDITGKNAALETATAMGAVVAAIHAHVEMMR